MDESRTSRKRGTQRSETARSSPPAGAEEPQPARGYARGRAKDEAVRRSLKPLRPGERPTPVTVGAIAAALLALANVIATIAGWDGATGSDDSQALLGSLLVAAVLALVAYGMWKARYWAVLGMQTLLAITIIFACLGLITATSIGAALLLVLIVVAAGALFWFLVKSMARIQMPERPGSSGQ